MFVCLYMAIHVQMRGLCVDLVPKHMHVHVHAKLQTRRYFRVEKSYSLRSIILFANIDVSRHILMIDTSVLAKSNMNRREYFIIIMYIVVISCRQSVARRFARRNQVPR
jgi:hypothetical protein